MNGALRMQKLKRADEPTSIHPVPTAVSRQPRLVQNRVPIFGLKKRLQWAPPAWVEDEVEALAIFAAGSHWNEEILAARQSCQSLKLSDLAPPDLQKVRIRAWIVGRPKLDQDVTPFWIPSPEYPGSAALLVGTNEIVSVVGEVGEIPPLLRAASRSHY
jgi:hypothetical protein